MKVRVIEDNAGRIAREAGAAHILRQPFEMNTLTSALPAKAA
ncbi:MAG TPA: hypothetical protein VM183_09695 [Burkholderiales bacterium]|nr:hypothetical protein [Burkholderiales bacterium]